MAYRHSVDQIIVSEEDFPNYNGHYRMDRFEVSQESETKPQANCRGPIEVSTWSSAECAQWLKAPPAEPQSPDGTLRLLMICTRSQSTAKYTQPAFPGRSDIFTRPHAPQRMQEANIVKEIFHEAQLPLAGFTSYVKTLTTFACVPRREIDVGPTHDEIKRYYCSGPSWGVTWTYRSKTRLTSAVLLYREGDGEARVKDFLEDLRRLCADVGHPMLLAYIKTKISLSRIFTLQLEMNFETLELENELGLPTWDWTLEREVPRQEGGRRDDRMVDRFSVLSSKVTNIRFRLRTLREQAKFVIRCNRKYQKDIRNDQTAVQKCLELHEMMEVISEYTSVHLYDAEALTERLSNSMTSLFQLTAQKDTRASIAIAKDSRKLAVQSEKDNSSMKTIAFATLFFLPPTFLATFFGMPMFDWNATADSGVVSRRFWIYWVVSVPLTIVICAGWLVWYWLTKKHEKERDEEAQDELKKSIMGRKRNQSTSSRGVGSVVKHRLRLWKSRPQFETLTGGCGREDSITSTNSDGNGLEKQPTV